MPSKKPPSPRSLRRAMREMKTLPWFLVFILIFCLMSGRDLFFASAMGGLVENALAGDMALLRRYLVLLGVATGVSIPLQLAVAYADGRYSIWGTRNLFRRVFPALARIPERVFERDNSAEMQSRMTGDVQKVQTFMHSELASIVWTSAYGLVPLFYLLYLNWMLALVCYGLIPLVYWVLDRVMAPLSRLTGELSAAQASALTVAQEGILQVEAVKSFDLEPTMRAQYDHFQDNALALLRKRKVRESISRGVNLMLSMLPTLLVILLGVWFVTRGSLSVAGLVVFVDLGSSGRWFISDLSEMLAQIRTANGHLTRIYEAVDTAPEREGGEAPDDGAQEVFRFEGARFAYEDREETLKGLSFCVRRGETVAIVGESGSGKSTLFKLIEGFYEPDQGRVSAFSRDVARVDLASLRDRIAIVPQDPFFMNGTLRENLVLGREDVDDGKILEALRVAGLGNPSAIWPDGLDTSIAERGMNLSGGQRQRVAIARAILRETPVLLFDEVTSALDYETEQEVYRAIQSLASEHTILIISHRLSIVRNADRILALEDGRVAEEGTHESLLAKDGVYAGLYRAEREGREMHA